MADVKDGHGYYRTITFRIPAKDLHDIDRERDLDVLVSLYEEGGRTVERTIAFRQSGRTTQGTWGPPYVSETDERTGY